jgi:ketosteroid isomerase-like protein
VQPYGYSPTKLHGRRVKYVALTLRAAEDELRHLANRYADGINRADFEFVAQTWAPDGVWSVPSPWNIRQEGRTAIRDHLVDRRKSVDIVVMTVCTVVAVEADERRILGRTTIEETGRRDAERGIHVLGLYDDELTNIDGRWYFARRTLNFLAVDNSPTVYTASPAVV